MIFKIVLCSGDTMDLCPARYFVRFLTNKKHTGLENIVVEALFVLQLLNFGHRNFRDVHMCVDIFDEFSDSAAQALLNNTYGTVISSFFLKIVDENYSFLVPKKGSYYFSGLINRFCLFRCWFVWYCTVHCIACTLVSAVHVI